MEQLLESQWLLFHVAQTFLDSLKHHIFFVYNTVEININNYKISKGFFMYCNTKKLGSLIVMAMMGMGIAMMMVACATSHPK